MKPHVRQAKILELLHQRGYITVEELSKLLDVSNMTIRRDLDQLQQMNLITRHFGGATLSPDHENQRALGDADEPGEFGVRLAPERGDWEWPWMLRQTMHLDEKRRIGKAAAALVRDDDIIIMDAGTTTMQVAKYLTQDRLTVISNFLPILCQLSTKENIDVIGIGGTLAKGNQWFIGQSVTDTIRTMNASVAIMATTGLSLTKGMTNRQLRDAEIKRTMIGIAEKVILVMDSSKMHRRTLANVGPLELIDIMVTDSGLTDEDRQVIEARGVNVIIAES